MFTSAGRLSSKASNGDWIDTPISELDIVKCVHSASGPACNITCIIVDVGQNIGHYFITKFTLIRQVATRNRASAVSASSSLLLVTQV